MYGRFVHISPLELVTFSLLGSRTRTRVGQSVHHPPHFKDLYGILECLCLLKLLLLWLAHLHYLIRTSACALASLCTCMSIDKCTGFICFAFAPPPPSNGLGQHGGTKPFQCRQTLRVTKQAGAGAGAGLSGSS